MTSARLNSQPTLICVEVVESVRESCHAEVEGATSCLRPTYKLETGGEKAVPRIALQADLADIYKRDHA